MSNVNIDEIKEHAPVIASCGTEIGKVDHLEGQDKIKLTRSDDENNEHHLIPTSWVSEIKDGSVILNKNSEDARNEWQTL
ncbi:DUF2171 domain-containing protein [Acinetobacter soli]|uniref:DUF2171 domain-containing protein n=1 Tax=Acinetobacter soli TaxID=487316 RepID=A0AB38Z2I4_9GAMM|nr:DUF2171 domain-containing protein [Acinetobacter soli]KQD01192.1 hypothetical protein APD01_00240 [Acinetobacter soli]WND07578.1 DUF2171 domain-containing protein [Acinetobacter soli]WND07590.1 DUF2171 domain-containing protein [Acinetobacter soli]